MGRSRECRVWNAGRGGLRDAAEPRAEWNASQLGRNLLVPWRGSPRSRAFRGSSCRAHPAGSRGAFQDLPLYSMLERHARRRALVNAGRGHRLCQAFQDRIHRVRAASPAPEWLCSHVTGRGVTGCMGSPTGPTSSFNIPADNRVERGASLERGRRPLYGPLGWT